MPSVPDYGVLFRNQRASVQRGKKVALQVHTWLNAFFLEQS